MGRDEAEAAAWKGSVPSSTAGRGNPRPPRHLGSIPGASARSGPPSLRLFWKLPVSPLLLWPAHPSRPQSWSTFYIPGEDTLDSSPEVALRSPSHPHRPASLSAGRSPCAGPSLVVPHHPSPSRTPGLSRSSLFPHLDAARPFPWRSPGRPVLGPCS